MNGDLHALDAKCEQLNYAQCDFCGRLVPRDELMSEGKHKICPQCAGEEKGE
jgi:formylmethanofuran dehydrogenase subunit E